MKKLVLVMILLSTVQAMACDVCNVYEYANRNNKSYIGAFYRYRVFNGYSQLNNDHNFFIDPQSMSNARITHEPEGYGLFVDRSPQDYERYQTLELRGNWAIKDNWNLTVFVPYLVNEIRYAKVYKSPYPVSDSTMRMSGLGDVILGGEYVKIVERGSFKHYVKPGAMVKFPTGQYNGKASNGQDYPHEIQTGTSSWDFIVRGSYTSTYDNKVGLENFLSYKFSTTGKNGFRFGNRFNWMTNLFVVVNPREGALRLIPKAGLYFEQASVDYMKEASVAGSGGYSWFYNLGLDFSFKSVTVQFMYQRILSEKLNGDVMGNAGRLQTGIIYNF